MALAQQDFEQLTTYIKQHIIEWVPQSNPMITFDLQLRDRMQKVEEGIQHNTDRIIDLNEKFVRVEEELKHQRELMQQGFDNMDKRFEQVDKRFEQVDKRFEQVDKRFEHVYSFMKWQMGLGFALAGGIYLKLFFG